MSFTPAKRTFILALLLLLLLACAFAIWSFSNRHDYSTTDAVVTADYTLVAPKVSGYIRSVNVEDNQQVKAGDVLATIDDRDYRVALETAEASLQLSQAKLASIQAQLEQQQANIAQAEAAVSASQATLNYAGQNAERYRRLLKSHAISADEQLKSASSMQSAAAQVKQNQAAVVSARKQVGVLQASRQQATADIAAAQASVDQARLNLSYTRIVAPIDGMIGQRAVRQGAWVSAGTRLLAVVPLEQSYVLANFLETQLSNVSRGQPVTISVDALPGVTLRGHVDSIAPATGATFAAISADNATGNYTKVVQRLPVKIQLEPNQRDVARLRVGMSVIPRLEMR
ncbi:HlyD family efflux transporter periplasmic adaptor subunit [Serratia rhizosphaerae]|uniref:HlyD family secretion protein n=1 Tax=unclassified Serratia (in: enterobacteria) TaxID=2647522 RepID=UPI000CF5F040|nr:MULTISPECIES: HlyD family secretion protein [unclassified Serratia (in: enterobacteria)]MBU3892167.1 HlyD family secretion protein [Serratia rubidaea]AVJ18489.1 efflux transporter periplasmic adaptor subunit [Serratia sp. MYb239]MCA4825544.1 HlyD family secretion protein [Serratia rubidaea]QNK34016.1 HlyD family secretion protein [Serratia sp. JUb9]QPT12042.1 HlyD family secretion protein [Serratia rubidaea]